jgi:hypothetical protein
LRSSHVLQLDGVATGLPIVLLSIKAERPKGIQRSLYLVLEEQHALLTRDPRDASGLGMLPVVDIIDSDSRVDIEQCLRHRVTQGTVVRSTPSGTEHASSSSICIAATVWMVVDEQRKAGHGRVAIASGHDDLSCEDRVGGRGLPKIEVDSLRIELLFQASLDPR